MSRSASKNSSLGGRALWLGALAAVCVFGLAALAWWQLAPGGTSVAGHDAAQAGGPSAARQVAQRDAEREREAASDAPARDGLAAAAAAPTWDGDGPAEGAARQSAVVEREPAPEELGRALVSWRGEVLARDGRQPIAGAQVELRHATYSRSAQSDPEGRFELAWPAGLPAELHLDHPAFVAVRVVEPNLEEAGSFELVASGRITGALSRPPAVAAEERPAGAACGRAWAWLQSSGNPRDWSARHAPIDREGRFRFDDLEPGHYGVYAELEGELAPFESGVLVESGREREVLLALAQRARLRGRVLEKPSLLPLEAVSLRARSERQGVPDLVKESGSVAAVSDGSGAFVLEGLLPGPYRVEFVTPWGATSTQGFEVAASGQDLSRDFQLPGPAQLAGRVFDAEGRARAGIALWCLPLSDREALEQASSGREPEGKSALYSESDGTFVFEPVPAGERLFVYAHLHAGAALERALIEVKPLGSYEQRRDVHLELRTAQFLRGEVRDDEGARVAGAELEFFGTLGRTRSSFGRTRSGADGRFEIGPLLEGKGMLQVRCSGFLSQALDNVVLGPEPQAELVLRLERAGRVRGHVVDERGYAVANLSLRLRVDPECAQAATLDKAKSRFLTRSDGLGAFEFGGLKAADWIVEPASGDYELLERKPDLARLGAVGQDAPVEIELCVRERLRPERASLRGFVRRADDAPLGGLRIDGFSAGTVEIDGGNFRISGLEPRSTVLRLQANGCVPLELPAVELQAGRVHDLGAIDLQLATRLEVRVVDGNGKLIPGARGTLRALPSEQGGTGEWSPPLELSRQGTGVLLLDRTPRKNFLLRVHAEGFARHERRLSVGPGAELALEVVLER